MTAGRKRHSNAASTGRGSLGHVAGRRGKAARRTHAAAKPRPRAALAQHPAFAPLLGGWGAALGGLTVLVLPGALVAPALAAMRLGDLGPVGQPMLAMVAALIGGSVLLIAASRTARKARQLADAPSLAMMAARRLRPINPKADLGIASLDEPLAAPGPGPATAPAPATASEPAPPVALDLAQFAALPGRNAVWVEESAPVPAAPAPNPAPAPAPVAVAAAAVPAPRRPAPSDAAIAQLRARPPEELSLVKMVERFAAAMHEHQAAAPGRIAHDAETAAAREAALAEALKTLAALGDDRTAPRTTRPMQDVVRRVHGLRGAA
jgi:hypothetical protein